MVQILDFMIFLCYNSSVIRTLKYSWDKRSGDQFIWSLACLSHEGQVTPTSLTGQGESKKEATCDETHKPADGTT